ncbi:hypothetical protein F5Y11DRAFT_365418 [Daldinia sp. FL1419]|nr:hypothetical protein F5Y11DRAFT_365418 [Daldinia sp. FL1419]
MAGVNLGRENMDSNSVLDKDISSVIRVCENLGGLLGICDEAREETKELALADHKHIALPSLGLTIGFPRQGVLRYLGNRSGGQSFLALVSALVTVFDPQECAQIIANLMRRHLKYEEAKYPAAEQLYPLLETINANCSFSSFASHVVDCEIILSHELRKRHYDDTFLHRLSKVPDTDVVAKMTELLLLDQAEHLDEDKPKAITVQAECCVPWIVVFVRWWLRKCPTVYLWDGQSPECETLIQGETKIGIKLVLPKQEDAPEYVKIRAVYSQLCWTEWNFHHNRAKHYNGLVPIPTYFRLMLNAFKLDQGQANKAAIEVIPYALLKARRCLTMCSEGCVSRTRLGTPCRTTTDIAGKKSRLWQQSQEDEKEAVSAGEALKRTEINDILRLVSGCEGKRMQDLRGKQMGLPIYGHKQVAAFLKQKRYENERNEWMKGFRSQLPLNQADPTTIFLEQMAHIVATILALSLFRNSEGLMVRPDPYIWQNTELAPSTEACCDVTEWHRGQPDIKSGNTIMSYGSGQVVCPGVIVDWKLPEIDESYLRLYYVVAMNSQLTSDPLFRGATAIPPGPMTADAASIQNSQYGFSTLPRPQDKKALECCMLRSLEHEGGMISSAALDPTGVFKCLASAERIESCPHDEKTPMELITTNILHDKGVTPTGFSDVYVCAPDDVLPWLRDWAQRADDEQVAQQGLSELLERVRGAGGPPGTVAVVPTAADDRLRVFTLAKPVGAHLAIRGHACLACCVNFCKYFGFDVLVL